MIDKEGLVWHSWPERLQSKGTSSVDSSTTWPNHLRQKVPEIFKGICMKNNLTMNHGYDELPDVLHSWVSFSK